MCCTESTHTPFKASVRLVSISSSHIRPVEQFGHITSQYVDDTESRLYTYYMCVCESGKHQFSTNKNNGLTRLHLLYLEQLEMSHLTSHNREFRPRNMRRVVNVNLVPPTLCHSGCGWPFKTITDPNHYMYTHSYSHISTLTVLGCPYSHSTHINRSTLPILTLDTNQYIYVSYLSTWIVYSTLTNPMQLWQVCSTHTLACFVQYNLPVNVKPHHCRTG